MRKLERGTLFFFFVLGAIAALLTVQYFHQVEERAAHAHCLKKHLGLEHDKWDVFSEDEVQALAQTVRAKLAELWNAKTAAYNALGYATIENRSTLLAEYQSAREQYRCFDKAVRAFGLWPPPKKKK